MELQLQDLKACERGLIKLMNSDLPARTSFRLTSILKVVRENLQQLEQSRTDLILKYGKEQKDGSTRVDPGTKEEETFKKEFETLLKETVVIDGYKPLTLDDLADARISAVELEPLMGSFIKPIQAVPDLEEATS